jgi:UDP-N-acetylmuramoyl-tripeptide--D-alanyl-D-alanine ligase
LTTGELYKLYLQHPTVQTDTRKLNKGDVFFALKGENFNGNAFAEKALNAGAAYAIIDEKEYAINEKCIVVEDVLQSLQQLALFHRSTFNIPFIAITGSNGKTTTKELLTQVLKRKFTTYSTEGNLNNHIGVPLTLLKIRKDAEMAVIEMGANHKKEIESYCKIALPTHGLITNCGKAHIEGFGGEEGVRQGKGELFNFLKEKGGTAFINADLPYLDDMARGINSQVSYGSANAHYIGKALSAETFLSVAVLTSGAETTINTNLVGQYNFPNVMAAVAIGLHFGISIDEIRAAVEAYAPDNSRSQLLVIGTNKVILDAYNANPSSMKEAISNFASFPAPRKLLWLGGMKEMGQDEEKEHKDLLEFIERFHWSEILLVGKEFAQLSGNHQWFKTSVEAAEYIKSNKPAESAILIKGSRGSKMENLVEALKS